MPPATKEEAKIALHEYDLTLEQVLDVAEEPGLGNGGLGRLAACYMESLSTLRICLLYTSPSPRDGLLSRMPSSA